MRATLFTCRWVRSALVGVAALVSRAEAATLLQEDGAGQSPRQTLPILRRYGQVLDAEAESPTASKAPITTAPTSITVIQGDDLRGSGTRYLTDALRMVPGVEVTRTSSTESNVNARGYNEVSSTAQGMLALIDGRLAYNEFFGNVFWDSLPVNQHEIDRVEVTRGPGSFLWGANAMQGMVAIYKKSPLDYEADTLELSTSFGSYGSTQFHLTQVRREQAAGFKVTASWDDIERFEGESRNTGDAGFVELRYDRELGMDSRIELTSGVSEHKQQVLIPTLQGTVPQATFESDVQETFLKANYIAGGFEAQVFWTGWDSDSREEQVYDSFSVDLDTADLDLKYTFDLGADERHVATAGAGYRRATFRTEDADVSDGRHATGLTWGFFQDRFEVSDRVVLTGGLRVDDHTISGTNLSPRGALVWEFRERQYFRVSAGSGFRTPSLRETWFDLPVLAGLLRITGNDDLDAEQMRSFELGYRGEFGEGLGPERGEARKHVKVEASVYYNLVDDLIAFEPVPGTNQIAPDNAFDEESYGFEAAIDYLVSDPLWLFANYSYGFREDRDTGERSLLAPENKANLGVRASLPFQGQGMLWLTYFDDVVYETGPVDDYLLLSGQISFPIADAGRWFVGGFNLLDDEHREHPEGERYGALLQAGVRLSW